MNVLDDQVKTSNVGEVINEGDEMGFFFLQDTPISLCTWDDKRNDDESVSLLPSNVWLNVDVVNASDIIITDYESGNEIEKEMNTCSPRRLRSRRTHGMLIDIDEKNSSNSWESEQSAGKCPRCNLVLHTANKKEDDNEGRKDEDKGENENKAEKVSSALQFRVSKKYSFNGCIQDTHCYDCDFHKTGSFSETENHNQKKRSDAALLLGTIMKCKDEGYVRVESFNLLLLNSSVENIGSTEAQEQDISLHGSRKRSRDDATVSNANNYVTRNACLVITVSLPHLERISKMTAEDGHHPVNYYDDYLSTDSRTMPPHGRLLFSLIRSDWDWLELAMRRLLNHVPNRKVTSSAKAKAYPSTVQNIFPDSISLEELYMRIRGASNSCLSSFRSMSLDEHQSDRSTKSFAGDLLLPDEILQSHLACYLRAKSLHNLRATCRYLNEVLRCIVPGMKLNLFPHQVRSLSWMRRREEIPMTEENAMMSGPNNLSVDEILSGDLYRSVTCGGIVSLTRRIGWREHRTFWQINAWTGTCSRHNNDRMKSVAKCRKVARGGLLCDDAGMGKTITIISLILQTFGQSSEKINEKDENRISEDLIIRTYWSEALVDFTRQDSLLCLILKVRKCDTEQIFHYPVESILSEDEFVAYTKVVKDPICMEEVIYKIRNDEYLELDHFSTDVKRIYNNAKLYNGLDTAIYRRAEHCLQQFQYFYDEFRKVQLNSAIHKQKRSTLSLRSLIIDNKRQELRDTLLPSKSTLILVPNILVDHWFEQIKLHVDFSCCSHKEPLIFRHRSSSKYKRELPYKEVSNPNSVIKLCQERKSHFPFLFIDECTDELPSEDFISMFFVVLSTTKRAQMEWKNGSPEEELKKGARNTMSSYRNFNYDVFNEYKHISPCSLLKINWLRLVVDEGHSMGKKGTRTNAIDFASWITADRRWVISGTPTPQTATKSGLSNLVGLFIFLNHDYFSTPHHGEERFKAFDKGLRSGHLASFFNLRHLLNMFMVRHTKADVEQLHEPSFSMKHIDMSASEKAAYNTLVTAVQMNLVTTSMDGKTSGKQDSLLNARQRKHAKLALSNIRLACCGGTKVLPMLTAKNWMETKDLMEFHGADNVKLTLVDNFLHRMTTEQFSSCMCCGIQLLTLFLLPCGCQICTECVKPTTSDCPACHSQFDADDFQRLQPGLEYTWKWNVVEAQKEREQAIRLAETLEATRQRGEEIDNGNEVEIHQREINGAVVVPIGDNPPGGRRLTRRRVQPNHTCEYSTTQFDGKCKHCGEQHLCTFFGGNKPCEVCNCKPEDCPDEESKAYYITHRLINLLSVYKNRGTYLVTGEAKRPLKVLIFTQFQQISNVVGDRLIRRFGRGCIAEYWGSTKRMELARFTKSNDCFCLLLNKNGSHGLNLNFVTHIFFLDEIFDKSLERQVIARAYRMGATENVHLEQLVARESIEELMVKMNKKYDQNQSVQIPSNENKKSNPPSAKIGYLLSNAKLIRPPKPVARTTTKRTDNPKRKQVQFILSV